MISFYYQSLGFLNMNISKDPQKINTTQQISLNNENKINHLDKKLHESPTLKNIQLNNKDFFEKKI